MISRRRFLRASTASAAGLLLGTPFLAWSDVSRAAPVSISGEYFLVGDGARGGETLFGATPYTSRPGRVRLWRFGQERVLEIPLPFLPHSFVPHPDLPHRVVTFEKWGMHLAELDLKTLAVVRVTRAERGRRFFGHGVHAGRHIYATQMDDDRGRGLVSVLDAATHRVVREIETQGAFPHDCRWLPDPGALLVVNSRRTAARREADVNFSSVVWLDVETGKCLKQVFIETREFGYAHLTRSAEGFVVLAGSYDPPKGASRPLLSVVGPDGLVRVLRPAPNALKGEVLSLYLDETRSLVAATLPGSSRIQVWNYRTGELVRQIGLGEPRGLAYSSEKNRLLVTSARLSGFLTLDEHFVSPDPKAFAQGLGGNGSHLCRLRI